MRTWMIGLASVAILGAVVYAALCALLYFNQEQFIFYRVANDPGLVRRWLSNRVAIDTSSGSVEGWWVHTPNSTNQDKVLLYFGGNAEDVLYMAESATQLSAGRILLTNYRGYGKSPGVPSEQGIFSDALAIYDWATAQPDVTADRIVVMGRSLGSGVATYLAAHRKVGGVVLVTPYDSLAAVGQGHYSYLPVSRLIKHKFPSDEFAKSISAPVQMIAAEEDRIVPALHARKLFEVWNGPKELHVLPGAGHNDVQDHPAFYKTINDFLSR